MQIFYAGPVKVGYENGFVRRISYGESEILRMIYFALRDHNWNTVPLEMSNEKISTGSGSFSIDYDCVNVEQGTPVMKWVANLSGQQDGSLVFKIQGEALRDLRKNRAGFCVLHPLQVAGTPCNIVHDDGSTSASDFPQMVAPDNPFKNIRSMVWKAGDHSFSLSFEGDVFETEDQRNWGDASFKTFCTPLSKPFPADLKKGGKVVQQITFAPRERSFTPASTNPVVTLRRTGSRHIIPKLGIGAATGVSHLSDDAIKRIKSLRLSHYRVELYPSSDRFAFDFSGEYERAYALGLPLEAALHLTDNFLEEMEAFTVICLQNKVRLKKVLLLKATALVTDQAIIDELPSLKASLPRVQFGAGTDYNFNELNKNRFRRNNLDFVSFSIDPQEHATDDVTILENTGTPEHLVASARAIYGLETPVHISPLTMRKRYNPYATNPGDLNIDEAERADPRQKTAIGALWTFGALCSAAKGLATSVTLYQTVGNQGIMQVDGTPYPLYDVIRTLSSFQGKPAEVLESSNPFLASGILLDGRALVLANMTTTDQLVEWEGRQFTIPPLEVRTEKI